MQNTTTKNAKLPFKCRMLVVSLGGASLMLALIFLLSYADYISTEVAIWAAVCVFIMAAIYESFLFSLITRHMLNGIKENPETTGDMGVKNKPL